MLCNICDNCPIVNNQFSFLFISQIINCLRKNAIIISILFLVINMCESLSFQDGEPEISEDIDPAEKAAKMRRMGIALRAVGGWFAYFMGNLALAFGLLTPLGTDLFSVITGLIICSVAFVLLFQHLSMKEMTKKELIVKLLKYGGLLFFIPGVLGSMITGFNSGLFSTILYTGLTFIVISFILKKAWKIKRPKKIKSLVNES